MPKMYKVMLEWGWRKANKNYQSCGVLDKKSDTSMNLKKFFKQFMRGTLSECLQKNNKVREKLFNG